MFGLFKKRKEIQIKSPISGSILPIYEIPDEVFGRKMIGDGIGILPSDGEIVSPVNGRVIQLFPTKHAIGIESEDGLELLIHVGIDTVKLKGESFEAFIKVGDTITVGQKLITFDTNIVKEKARSLITPFIITNIDMVSSLVVKTGEVTKGQSIVMDVVIRK